MAGKCKCCARTITGNKCSYCKYINVEFLDNSGSEVELTRVVQYKEELLKSITGFYINAYTYKWNSDTSKLYQRKARLKIANGVECFNKIAWLRDPFGKNLDEKQQELPITILYKFDKKDKELNISLKTIKCNDLWKLGVMIHHNMTVSFYLGTSDNHTISKSYDLEFE